MKILELSGDHYSMGWQHGRQVRALRPKILRAMEARLDLLKRKAVCVQPLATELAEVWEETARPTMEMLRGMAEALALDWEAYFCYTIASYLEGRALRSAIGEGCTNWAASDPVTRLREPILAKNRDYRPDHRALQCLARAWPSRGYRYLYVTSAGSPAVFSSGMNERGLVVADTHVASLDVGPGLARYSLMMEVLEHHSGVASALEYLASVRHMGNGTLMLLDEAGKMAVFESGHTTQGNLLPNHSYVVSTNHFVSASLAGAWVDLSPPASWDNSRARYARVEAALRGASGTVDVSWAQGFMGAHGSLGEAICRHRQVDPRSVTISSVLFLPRRRCLHLANGYPCRTTFQNWPVAP